MGRVGSQSGFFLSEMRSHTIVMLSDDVLHKGIEIVAKPALMTFPLIYPPFHIIMKDFNVSIQFCIAHLIRNIKFLVGLPDAEIKTYGQNLLDEVRDMFRIIHQLNIAIAGIAIVVH